MTLADQVVEVVLQARHAGSASPELEQLAALPDVADGLRRRRILADVATLKCQRGLSTRSACAQVARREGFTAEQVRGWLSAALVESANQKDAPARPKPFTGSIPPIR